MNNEKLVQFIQGAGLFARPKAEEIANHFAEKIILKNDLFLKAGRVSDEYLFLEEGFMRSFAYDTEGNDITTNFSPAGRIVLEVSSFFNRTVSRENIQAITNCKGWFITYQQWQHHAPFSCIAKARGHLAGHGGAGRAVGDVLLDREVRKEVGVLVYYRKATSLRAGACA